MPVGAGNTEWMPVGARRSGHMLTRFTDRGH
jgi:hypothetical protein